MASGVLLHDDRFELPHVGGIGGGEAEAAVPASPNQKLMKNLMPLIQVSIKSIELLTEMVLFVKQNF